MNNLYCNMQSSASTGNQNEGEDEDDDVYCICMQPWGNRLVKYFPV